MSIMRRCLTASIVAALAISSAAAQPPMPKPGPEHAQLKKLEGIWDTVMKMGPNESKGVASYKMDLGGLWLASTFESSMAGEKFSGRGFDSYDADKKKYVGVWFDNMSTKPMILEGTFDVAAKTMTMSGDAPGMDGKMVKHKIVTVMPDDNTINFAMYVGDGKQPEFTIVYKRRK